MRARRIGDQHDGKASGAGRSKGFRCIGEGFDAIVQDTPDVAEGTS
jgi:hypothetical protein